MIEAVQKFEQGQGDPLWGLSLFAPDDGLEWSTFEIFLPWDLVRTQRDMVLALRASCCPSAVVCVDTYYEMYGGHQVRNQIAQCFLTEEPAVEIRFVDFKLANEAGINFVEPARFLLTMPSRVAYNFKVDYCRLFTLAT